MAISNTSSGIFLPADKGRLRMEDIPRIWALSTFNVANSTIGLRPTMVLGCRVWIHFLTRVNKPEWIMIWYESMWAILTMTGCIDVIIVKMIKMTIIIHSVESPSMVDPQWSIWHWGSKWNLRTVCWDAVGCEWGTTSVYFGITYICFIPSRLPVFAVEPQYRHQEFLFLSKVSYEGHIHNLQKISCWFKFKWGL